VHQILGQHVKDRLGNNLSDLQQVLEAGPHKADGFLIAGYLICKAANLEEVTAWSKAYPILKYEHGSVEVREMMPFSVS
jgi:hypothetical protein